MFSHMVMTYMFLMAGKQALGLTDKNAFVVGNSPTLHQGVDITFNLDMAALLETPKPIHFLSIPNMAPLDFNYNLVNQSHRVLHFSQSRMSPASFCPITTQVLSTELEANSLPPRTHTANSSRNSSSTIRRHAAQDRDAAATARDWRRRAELQAMDLEDAQIRDLTGARAEEPVTFSFSLNSRTMHEVRSRIDRRRLRRSHEKKKFNHQVAVGFVLDEAEEKFSGSGGNSKCFSSFSGSGGLIEARMSRRAVKQLMQRILPHVAGAGESDSSSDEEQTAKETSRLMDPTTLHRNLGESANSLAYVGKTGRVICHGREFLQCERYGAGDVVGCGVLFDTNTFFFTLNGRLMGMLAARDVYDLDDFGEVDIKDNDEDENDEKGEETNGDENNMDMNNTRGEGTELDRIGDVDMEDADCQLEEEKAVYASVSLHGAGESIRAVFDSDEFQFDLIGFEQQIRKDRQRALLTEHAKRNESSGSSGAEKDEAAMHELVQDFFLHYGYESAYNEFKSVLTSTRQARFSSDGMEVDCNDEAEASTVTLGMSSVDDMEEDSKSDEMDFQESLESFCSPEKQHMRDSLALRHEIREHIRCFRTAQALVALEQHYPTIITDETGSSSRSLQRLVLYCRILCVIDILTSGSDEKETVNSSIADNGVAETKISATLDRKGWNPVSAIELAQHVFRSSLEATTNGKRKRHTTDSGVQVKEEDTNDVSLAMSLLLYDRPESIPPTSRALKFLTPEFRESVADQLNSLLLVKDRSEKPVLQASALETFMQDLRNLQRECLHQGCRVYPESVSTASKVKCKTIPRRRRVSVSSSSDDSCSSHSQSDQDDRLEDVDDDYD
ncbi:unnamed protein product [Phytophthora lilii]|uniref:Unnamed protein product n=1 Tax=Phytophthora lilii TaxID=2077276 RepID=A0A9W6UDT0_9STRA|nr:unnamed protein product [Phytophthora lilii]